MQMDSAKRANQDFEPNGSCTYAWSNGRYVIVSDDSNPGYFCSRYWPGGNGSVPEKTVQAIPNPDVARETADASVPRNAGEYVFYRGDEIVALVRRGECDSGRILIPSLRLDDVAALDPKAFEMLAGINANELVSRVHFNLPAASIKGA